MISSASSTSTCSSASSVRSSCSTTMSRPPSAEASSSAMRSWKISRVTRSPELARHVFLRAGVAGLGEDHVGRAERAAGLVHEDHVGLDRDPAGDAQALLLATGEADPGLAQAILDLVPQAGAAQRA